ncbi:MAG: hypothetical protein AAB767_02755 [Patescibacteria group bacterium]
MRFFYSNNQFNWDDSSVKMVLGGATACQQAPAGIPLQLAAR